MDVERTREFFAATVGERTWHRCARTISALVKL